MKKICTHLILILIAFCNIAVLTGCGILDYSLHKYTTPRYRISLDNVTTLRALGDNKINVGDFTSYKPGSKEILCRGVGRIKTPDGNTYADFIKEALIDELQFADLYYFGASVTLTGNLDSIDFSSYSGKWDIALTVNSSNGESISVSETYSFKSSWDGWAACLLTGDAFVPAVQNLIAKLVGNPKFPYLIK